ncbi:hypothetical protein RN001_007077 [Aquatica leii]|uniref:Peptidase S1 domain-containing protein n=1 Tax=Aquatica leii TaxID=1421715 RepID=A0AAN7PCM3_9COLE|nr:hypothetical protein RN001_007077 [Aquatica leii]
MYATGFGSKQKNGAFVDVKKKVVVTLASRNTYFNNTNVTQYNRDNFICAMESQNNTVHLCDGDYGGPLMILDKFQWYLHGLYSWSVNNCNGQDPVFFTRVGTYLDWIRDNVHL